jgi:magnesium and cobalt transporter
MSAQHPKSWFERLSDSFHSEPSDTQELLETLRAATKRKIIDASALAMIEGALNVSTLQVRDIMIPRSQMICIELHQSAEEFMPTLTEAAHSRFPVIGEDKDDVVGILLAKELLKHMVKHPKEPLVITPELLRPATFVPESKRLDTLLKEFRSSRNHLAIVVDEYGGIAGLVTIEDVLEEIVGEIEDEFDSTPESWIQAQSDQSYLISALTPIEDFNHHFKTTLSDKMVDTIGGLVTLQLGHLPSVGETITVNQFHFTVTQADRRRIKQVQMTVGA